ncbi:hypothetical protein Dsin_016716 [Dipteronia sinensis]|uniref:DUF1985 domain-containing protein n=1 Tax=Dipteronia sinensis TaxID=43782 RepID=A0AAE0ADM0_9ROSI|nr:hypothetical protein Dsin_016716 [Dipteronia sinensis]
MLKATCFCHFLDVSDMVLSGHLFHHILLRECHVKNDEENSSNLWYHVGNRVIRFSPVEFCLVTGLAFGEHFEYTSNLFNRKNSRLCRSYFQESKVSVKMVIDWFRNLIPNNNNNSDEDIVKLALILLLELTLVWGIETIPKWAAVGYVVRVNNVTPRILNWQCTETPAYVDILKTIFKFKNLNIYKVLGLSDDEPKKPYWTGMDQLQYVSPDVDGCDGEDDIEDDVEDDVQHDVGDANQNDNKEIIKLQILKNLKSEERRKK